ncbi:hypothetical protein P3T40_007459 [Paraburkholderia sp. EB58]|jgi:hypothetical protein|uniref:hypothetical protein n=1 Tax=Paraburkholderia sp. EB58 TaxID=3035125 RepID=UPI003D1DE7BD
MTGMSDFAVTLLSSAGVSVVLGGALVWLLRTWIGERVRGAIQAEYAEKLETLRAQLKAEADLKLETYKATLKGQADVELEKLRASLAIAAAAHSAKYGGLVERRFEAIASVHAHLLRVHGVPQATLLRRIDPRAPDSEDDSFIDAFRAFSSAYQDWRIFLPKRTADRIDGIMGALTEGYALVATTLASGSRPDLRRKLQERFGDMGWELSAALADLEAELRALMGDEPASAQPVTGAPPLPASE